MIKKYKLIYLMTLFLMACGPRVEHRWVDSQPKDRFKFKVERVLSGDSIKLLDGRIIKYIGIRAPRRGEYFFEKARRINEDLIKLSSGRVLINLSKTQKLDSRGRYLAYVFCEVNKDVYCFANLELISLGMGIFAAEEKNIYREKFIAAQNKAQRKELGIWRKLRSHKSGEK